ncbi:ABC transporter ATP-binding protein [Mesorhizobium sp. KR9-304]|uniref:ABC transporter ATP-binding protein n=1 Tax=Mesorhizobium sp. KR9-304 TaxID=3156614 RepID=UPI0032B5E112
MNFRSKNGSAFVGTHISPPRIDADMPLPSAVDCLEAAAQRLQVRNLSVSFNTPAGRVVAVDNVSFEVGSRQILALVGESGSGKSVTAMALIGLLARNASISGSICLGGDEIVGMAERDLQALRGSKISMIFQNPRASLNPSLTIGNQMIEVIRRHSPDTSREAATEASIAILRRLNLRDAERQINCYPHELSGGMCQRVALGIALTGAPQLLIADEPTTALDVVVQAKTLQLLREIHGADGLPMIIVTHDFGVVRAIATHVAVMYAGQIQEAGPVDEVLERPTHPYTQALIATIPDSAKAGTPLIQIDGGPPDPLHFPPGCRFAPRCHKASDVCLGPPSFKQVSRNSRARCHFVSDRSHLS